MESSTCTLDSVRPLDLQPNGDILDLLDLLCSTGTTCALLCLTGRLALLYTTRRLDDKLDGRLDLRCAMSTRNPRLATRQGSLNYSAPQHSTLLNPSTCNPTRYPRPVMLDARREGSLYSARRGGSKANTTGDSTCTVLCSTGNPRLATRRGSLNYSAPRHSALLNPSTCNPTRISSTYNPMGISSTCYAL
jgi:hypothetical protein